MALLYVMWSVALLTVVATTALSSGTTSYQLARNSTGIAQQEALAEAALSRAVLGLLDKRPQQRWRANGVLQNFSFDGVEMKIAIQDQLGCIDLNHANAALLSGLLRAGGVAADKAEKLADAIADWRDSDDLRRLHGAERTEYSAAGFPDRPRNGAFQNVDELMLVLGMSPDIFRRIEPALTVYSGRPNIDPEVAPPLARQALFGGRASKANSFQPQDVAAAYQFGTLDGRAFRVRIGFAWRGGKVAREAVIRMTGDPNSPYWLLGWRDGYQSSGP